MVVPEGLDESSLAQSARNPGTSCQATITESLRDKACCFALVRVRAFPDS
jgi:hypothetical protein